LPTGVEVVEDPVEGLGPMRGIATGLAAVRDLAPAAFVCATDMPFLHPAFVNRVLREFAVLDTDVVLPTVRGFRQPLAAVYRTALAALVADLASGGELRLGVLFEHCRARRIHDQELLADAALARFDADLESVTNLNTPSDYEAARARLPAEVTVQCFGALASGGCRGPRTVRAATLGAAAQAVDIPLDKYVVAALHGDLRTHDPHLPLVAGDTVALLSADTGR
jgi:molybdopterin-guanine dinucleotide biosynthesis protein A